MIASATADLYLYEEQCYHNGFIHPCGVDEAGRGPLAGDVFAAAVMLPRDLRIERINDSKKLSEKKREYLFDQITEQAVSYAVATATVEEIDRLNILQATLLAMQRAVAGLSVKPDYLLIDGNRLPNLSIPAQAIIKGDARSASIAAASILAKVSRDRYMHKLAELYPEYSFDRHKGYPTQLHYQLLGQHGLSPVHRRSFLKGFSHE